MSIARALVKNADIILCDEPTVALDDKTGRKILELIQDIVRKQGQTMIIVTHTTPISLMANRIITLKNGQIVKENVNKKPLDAKEKILGGAMEKDHSYNHESFSSILSNSSTFFHNVILLPKNSI